MKGRTRISERALSRIALHSAATVPGVSVTSGGFAGLGGGYPRCDVSVDRAAGRVRLDLTIAVSWPAPVSAVAAHTRETIGRHVAAATGLSVSAVNVSVEQVLNSRHRVTEADLTADTPDYRHREVALRSPTPVRSPQLIRLPAKLSTRRPLTPVRTTAVRPLRPVRVLPLHPRSPGHQVARELAEERRMRELR